MKEAIELIKERLEKEKSGLTTWTEDEAFKLGIEKAQKIVSEVETEYGNGWVSCSERLPEESGRYITTNMYEGEKEEAFDMWYEDGKWFIDSGEDETIRIVLAWKPLPDPYKPEKGE